MNGRLAALLALTLVGTALTGCLQTPDFLKASTDEVGAMDNRGAADEAAKAWNPEAKLVGVGAIETTEEPKEADLDGDGETADDVPVDPEVGNGLARVWWYAYASSDDIRAFRVLADGTVERQDDGGFGAQLAGAGMPLGEWNTDSDGAIQVAKDNGTFLTSIAGENATVVHVLVNEDGQTLWRVIGISRAGVAIATVDAKDARLVEVRDLRMGDLTIPSTSGFAPYLKEQKPYVDLSDSGSVKSGQPKDIPFELPADAKGMIHFAAQGATPMDGIHWSILDESGETVAEDQVYGGFFGDRESASDLQLPAGNYTLHLESTQSTPGPFNVGGSADYALRLFLGPPGLEMHEKGDGN